jgi:hypothetical protein
VYATVATLVLLAAGPPAPAVAPSAPVWRLRGETTDGRAVVYPDDARGKPLVVVVGLTQASAKATATWTAELQSQVGARVAVVGVALLDQVPGFARGFVKRAIAKAVGPPQTGKAAFVSTFDGGSIRATAPAGDKDDPVVYVFRPDGSVASVAREAYSAGAETSVERALTP